MREMVPSVARRVRVITVLQTLTLPPLRDGPLPLPYYGRGAYTGRSPLIVTR